MCLQRCALELSFCSAHLRHNHKTASLRLNSGMNGDFEQDLQAAGCGLNCAKSEKGVDDAPKMRSEATIRREAAQTEGRAHERLCREVAARSRVGRLAHSDEQRPRRGREG